MERIKKYFSNWDASRIIRLILGIAMTIGYISTRETIYLFGGIIFLAQAALNIGCPGGACSTNATQKDEKQGMTFKKYEPKK